MHTIIDMKMFVKCPFPKSFMSPLTSWQWNMIHTTRQAKINTDSLLSNEELYLNPPVDIIKPTQAAFKQDLP
jgi:hypothetical protein